ncbi:DUF3157 family protein [Mariniflexile sp.]|uniref:DUF3157 family protein n=1 Tax=Mariniflexile sp. TaxID=1979402 RepID=UPI003567A0E4
MKNYCLTLFLFVSFLSLAQNNHIVKTEDGRRVLLKSDYTWEYIDAESTKGNVAKNELTTATEKDACKVDDDFKEPDLNSRIQSQLKKGRATIDYVKAKVAKDYACDVNDVLLLSFSEQKEKAVYDFCANGKKVTYKRTGHTIIESGKLF